MCAGIIFTAGCGNGGQGERRGTDAPEEPTAVPTATPVPRDVSADTPAAGSMVYANEMANAVQGYYPTAKRDVYVLKNKTMTLTHRLFGEGGAGLETFSDAGGNAYFGSSFDTYVIDSSGNEWTERFSPGSGRINTTRLGYYYYEAHVRDLGFGREGKAYSDAREIADFSKQWRANDGSVKTYPGERKAEFTVSSAHDPYFVVDGFSVPGDKVSHIELTMSVKGAASRVELFVNDGNDFNQKQALSFSVYADKESHTYLIDISSIHKNGPLTGLRFDIGENVGDVITVTSVRTLKPDDSTPALKTEKTYHTFSDKLHQQFRIVAYEKIENITEFGMVWNVDASSVDSVMIRDANGNHSDLNFDPATVEFVAFDFKNAGICGIIIPSDGDTKEVTVTLSEGRYTVRQKYAGRLSLRNKGHASVANRLYNDATHSFEGIEREAYIERNPLGRDDIKITGTDAKARFKGYDAVRGVYLFTMDGTTFNTAYQKENNNRYFSASVSVQNGDRDRKLYLDFNSSSECLECGVITDENGTLLPIPVMVCKNFTYEKEEPVYDPTDVPYSDTFFPLSLTAGEKTAFTQYHLYQNWGVFPLKQLSSIQFHVSYYHLSTGVTESNCIAPYYVYGRDGWTLPDFRGASGIMWPNQPQFTAGGHNKFVSYRDSDGTVIRSEYTKSNILSYGPVYADLEYSYKADSGEYEYTLRHTEFPQTDENRTYYTLSLRFLKDTSFDSVRDDFTLHYFDSRDQHFGKLSFTGGDGTVETVASDFSKRNMSTAKLAKDRFWFAFYGSDHEDCMNEAFIMKKYDIKLGGEQWNGGFVLRHGYDGVMYNISELSLDLGKHTFRKGDTIYLEFLLVPWGNTDHDTYSNVERMFEDSVLKPLKVDVRTGRLVDEPFLPHIVCENNYAEFTVSGGRNKNAVRIDGFTSLAKPVIEKLNASGEWEPYETSVKPFDGYGVQYVLDGTYAYSFIFEQESPDGSERDAAGLACLR